jgi:acyl CoA:acetate/3-ketoacid CoA transferase alpha subunit
MEHKIFSMKEVVSRFIEDGDSIAMGTVLGAGLAARKVIVVVGEVVSKKMVRSEAIHFNPSNKAQTPPSMTLMVSGREMLLK